MTKKRTDKGQFAPGVSGNPKGGRRPTKKESLSYWLEQEIQERGEGNKTKAQVIAEKLVKACMGSKQKNAFLRAIELLFNRLEGKPLQAIRNEAADGYVDPVADAINKLREEARDEAQRPSGEQSKVKDETKPETSKLYN